MKHIASTSETPMTIAEIQKVLRTSFKNGFYIRRPSFVELDIEIYINKAGMSYHCQNGKVWIVELTRRETEVNDWEIVP